MGDSLQRGFDTTSQTHQLFMSYRQFALALFLQKIKKLLNECEYQPHTW